MKLLAFAAGFLSLCSAAFGQMGKDLCPTDKATIVAIKSGSWQGSDVWGRPVVNKRTGKVTYPAVQPGDGPKVGEKVWIQPNLNVVNNGVTADVLWVHVAGTLTGCDHCDNQLNVGTIYVPMGGWLNYGMQGMPRTGKAIIEYTGGPFLEGDWQKLSNGLICHGTGTACGKEKTDWDDVTNDLAIGATSLTTKNVAFGWEVGDEILIAGTDSLIDNSQGWYNRKDQYQSEFRTITAISGKTVTWAVPLVYKHWRWRADIPYHVANLTRNVVIRSRKTDIPNRGHNMFMSSSNDLSYVEIKDCGRTDKSKPVTDPRNDAYGAFVPGSADNPRARYADHNHRSGQMNSPYRRRGCVFNGSPGFGSVNHASNGQYDNCIALNTYGSGLFSEEGQERGYFRHCLSALNRGRGDIESSTDSDHGERLNGDWGRDGSGIWLQGGMVDVEDCVCFDNGGRGFALFNSCLNSYPDYGQGNNAVYSWIQYPIAVADVLLPEGYFQTYYYEHSGKANPNLTPSMYVPQRVFNRNSSYCNKVGLQSWCLITNINHTSEFIPVDVRGQIDNFTTWGRGCTLHFEYTSQFDVHGLIVKGDSGFRGQYYASTNGGPPIQTRGAHVSIYNVQIEDVFNRDAWPNPYPIMMGATPSETPLAMETIKIQGTYPVMNGTGQTITLQQP